MGKFLVYERVLLSVDERNLGGENYVTQSARKNSIRAQCHAQFHKTLIYSNRCNM